MRIPIYAANWKMNKKVADIDNFWSVFSKRLKTFPKTAGVDFEVVLAPMALHTGYLVSKVKGTAVRVSAQNSGTDVFGAYTGEISPLALQEQGCGWVIVGHSERRHIFKESDELIQSRIRAALTEGLKVIFCVGERLESRRAGMTVEVIRSQLSILKDVTFENLWDGLVIAYEPVWAIGTGETATSQQVQEVHAFIRKWISDNGWAKMASEVRILYGGSAKPSNSQTLMVQSDVDGLLVGTASLDATTFADLIQNGLVSPD